MEQITQRLALDSLNSERVAASLAATTATRQSPEAAPARTVGADDALHLTVDAIPHPAYMLNYRFELIWYNEAARRHILGGFAQLPPQIEARNVFRYLLDENNESPLAGHRGLVEFHLGLAKDRLAGEGLTVLAGQLAPAQFATVQAAYAEAPALQTRPVAEFALPSFDRAAPGRSVMAYATQYREGVLFVYVPADHPHDSLLHLLARRDEVIRSLLRRRLPVLTHLVALVADLQNSVRICAELPPEEYFELINQIWSTLDPIFRKYYGAYGKHTGDGLIYYFFPQPDSSYILNALRCAVEIREAMRTISKEWQIRKGWFNELHMNVGLNEGQEWLGTFQTSTTVELTVLGDTINQAARLSDLARFGEIWTTKGLLAKLSPEAREGVQYGVRRRGPEGREQFVQASYTTVSLIGEPETSRCVKLCDIAHLPIAEIVEVK